MLTKLAHLAQRSPRRVIAIAVALAVFAAVTAGGVADRLGPYAADDPDSETYQASKELREATGLMVGDDAVVLVRAGAPVDSAAARAKVDRVAAELEAERDVGRVTTYYDSHDHAMVSRDGRSTYVVATFRDGAGPEEDVAERIEQSLAGQPGVIVGGGCGSERCGQRDRRRGPRPRRDDRVPAPLPALVLVLPQPRERAPAAARGRPRDRAHVPRPPARERGHRALGVRAQPRHRPRPRPGDRLEPLHGLALSRGDRDARRRPRGARAHRPHGRAHGRLQRAHGRGGHERRCSCSRRGSSTRWAWVA